MRARTFLTATWTLAAVLLGACAAPTPIVQTVVVEREVTAPAATPAATVVAVTPTPIGGKLTLYSCLFDPGKLAVLFETFQAQYGVEVGCLAMSSGEALERIRAERDNPQGDVLFGTTTNLSHITLASEGLSEPYKGVGWNLMPEGPLKDTDGYWTGLYYGVIGFACSPARLQAIGAECPDAWSDLLDPVFLGPDGQGEIVIASPSTSGTSYTVLSGLVQLLGEEGAFAWYTEFDKNVSHYTDSGSEPAKVAASGEFAVGVAFAHDIKVQQDLGLEVDLAFPSEGTPYEIGGISIIKGTQNLAAAQAWVDYVFGQAFQRYHNDVAHRIPVVPGVRLAEGTVGLEDVDLIEGYDPAEWAVRREALVARWQEVIGSLRGLTP